MYAVVYLVVACVADAVSPDAWKRQLQPLVDAAAKEFGSAYAVGLVSRNVSMELVAGYIDTADGKNGTPARVGDGFPLGSVTKTMTGAGILQLVASGKLKLDDPAEKYVDPMLKRAGCPYSMQELFRADHWSVPPAVQYNASEITVRHLMGMLSGIQDYDTLAFRDFQYENPKLNVSPKQILDWVHGPLMFQPGGPLPQQGHPYGGTGTMNYCSVNFIILGYILAYFAGVEGWSDYDQASVVPTALRSRMAGLSFAKGGTCGEFTRVHGYDGVFDVSNTSCSGGWTAGNVVMPALAAAEWTRALWGTSYSILPEELVEEMVHFQNHSFYGLATMNIANMLNLGFLGEYGLAVGHLGDTYGFTSIVAYFPKLDVGLAVATNHETARQDGPKALLCTLYNRVVDILLHQRTRNCTYVPGEYWNSTCKCDEGVVATGTELLV